MPIMSDYLEDEIIKHIFRTGSFTKPSVLAVALCTSIVYDHQDGSEISEVANDNNYARVMLNPLDANWSATDVDVSNGKTSNLSAITFNQATGSWGTITHMAICDSATYGAGNVLFHGALSVPKTISEGDTLSFGIGDLEITIDGETIDP